MSGLKLGSPRALDAPADGAHERALERALAEVVARERPGARLLHVRRRPLARASSWWLEEVHVELDDGHACTVIFKDLGREAPGSRAYRAKPARVVAPEREPWVYRQVLGRLCVGTPRLLGAVSDAGRHWLFLEPVAGVPLNEVAGDEAWIESARWLARFHERSRRAQVSGSPLIDHTPRLHHGWLARAVARGRSDARRGGSAGSQAEARLDGLREITTAHAAAADAIPGMLRTVVHGEFYPSNVLVENTPPARVRPLDWEMAGLGPCLLDLAALTAGRLPAERRRALAMAYHGGARAAGLPLPPPDAFLRALTACRLLLAVQWLGWGRDWTPPREHENDWLAEARACARELT
jgi:Ser/Thr protein kinase RdoA (MazF antagonist)